MKRTRALIIVAAAVVAVLPLCGCTGQDWNNFMIGAAAGWNQNYRDAEYRRQRVLARIDQQDREDQARRLAEQRNALLAEQNAISREHALHPFGRRW